MFINIKLSSIFKAFCVIVVILMVIFFCIGTYRIFTNVDGHFTVSDEIKKTDVIELTPTNYTNVLKTVHENIDSYVGMKIHFTGYVYRVFDLTDTQFVLARNMIISSDYQAIVVGFLSNYKDAQSLPDNIWVEVTGTITKGDYHGEIPIIEINDIKQVEAPTDEYVYPPDDSYVPTNALL